MPRHWDARLAAILKDAWAAAADARPSFAPVLTRLGELDEGNDVDVDMLVVVPRQVDRATHFFGPAAGEPEPGEPEPEAPSASDRLRGLRQRQHGRHYRTVHL